MGIGIAPRTNPYLRCAMTAEKIAERALALAATLANPSADGRSLVDAASIVGEIRRLADGAGIELAGQIDELSRAGQEVRLAARLGERSPAMVLQAYAGLDAAESFAWCRIGAALRPEVTLLGEVLPSRHEPLAAALADGRMHVGGAVRVLDALDAIAPFASPDEVTQVEAFLVAERPHLTDRQFARVCGAVPEQFVPGIGAEREDELRGKAGITIRKLRNGIVRMTVDMHPEAAGFITTALDARTAPRRQPTFVDPAQPPTEADPRTLAQQRLDAMTSMARESLAHDTGSIAGTSVTMSVTMTLEALLSGIGTAKIAGVDEPISAATARRLAADAEIIPVVLGGSSEPLDLGRAFRLSSEPQRRALAVRDEGCIWQSCDVPPAWCEVAHINPWASGGTTDLDNLMLLCPFHHRRFDLDGWALEKIGDERFLIPPPWVDSARTPRRVGPTPTLAMA